MHTLKMRMLYSSDVKCRSKLKYKIHVITKVVKDKKYLFKKLYISASTVSTLCLLP